MNIVLDVLRYLNEHDITLVKAAEATGVAQQNIKKASATTRKQARYLLWQADWALTHTSSSMIWTRKRRRILPKRIPKYQVL